MKSHPKLKSETVLCSYNSCRRGLLHTNDDVFFSFFISIEIMLYTTTTTTKKGKRANAADSYIADRWPLIRFIRYLYIVRAHDDMCSARV